MTADTIEFASEIMGFGIGIGFGLFCLFSLLSYAIRELIKLFNL